MLTRTTHRFESIGGGRYQLAHYCILIPLTEPLIQKYLRVRKALREMGTRCACLRRESRLQQPRSIPASAPSAQSHAPASWNAANRPPDEMNGHGSRRQATSRPYGR